ncbi:MAG: hypothetical protein GY754_12060 [bacterium]|nr:hypothetical protein [bacterium]
MNCPKYRNLFITVLLIPVVVCTIACTKTASTDDYVSISKDLRKKPIPWSGIEDFYKKSNLKKELDKNKPALSRKVEQAIKNAIIKKKPHIQKQVVSKDIQKYFCDYLESFFNRSFEEVSKQDIEKAGEYYNKVIVITANRRIQWLKKFDFTTPQLLPFHSAVVSAPLSIDYERHIKKTGALFKQLEQFKAANSKEEYTKTLAKAEEFTAFVYYLAMLYEIEGIKNNRTTDAAKTEEKLYEAKLFYSVIQYYPEKKKVEGNELQHTAIVSELAKDPGTINLQNLFLELRNRFPFFY